MSIKGNVHTHIFTKDTIPGEIYFGRHELSKGAMKIVRWILSWVEKNGLPDDIEELISIAEKVLPLFGVDDEWARLKQLVKMYYMSVPDLLDLYEKKILPGAGIEEMCILIPNFPGDFTHNAVDIICAAASGREAFKVFAPLAFVERDDVFGIKYYPALEGPPDAVTDEFKKAADLNKPISSHQSPGGVRNAKFPVSLAKKYNQPGRWMDALEKYPIRVCLDHVGGRNAFVSWLTDGMFRPGVNWSFDNMMRSYDGIEYPGKVYFDVAFHEKQTNSDYRKAIANLTGHWNNRGMFGNDEPLSDVQGSMKEAAGWFRNVWGVDGVNSANDTYKEFLYGCK